MNPPPVPQTKTSGLAITSLVFGILSVTCCGLISGIVAIITGHIARSRIKSGGGTEGGAGLALAGLIMGYLSIVLTIIAIVAAVPSITTAIALGKASEAMERERQIVNAVTTSEIWPADSGATSAPDFFSTLVEKNALAPDELALLRAGEFLIGNVSASDPAETILVRTKPGIYSNGYVVAGFKNGEVQIFQKEDQVTGSPAPRDPAYLNE